MPSQGSVHPKSDGLGVAVQSTAGIDPALPPLSDLPPCALQQGSERPPAEHLAQRAAYACAPAIAPPAATRPGALTAEWPAHGTGKPLVLARRSIRAVAVDASAKRTSCPSSAQI